MFLGRNPKIATLEQEIGTHVCDPKMQQTPPEVDFGILRISSKRCALMKSMFTVLNSVQQNSIVRNVSFDSGNLPFVPVFCQKHCPTW